MMRRTATALAAALALYAAGCGGGEEVAPEEPAAAAPAASEPAPASTTAEPASDDCTDRSYWTALGYSRGEALSAEAHAAYFVQWTDIDPCQYTDPAALEAARDKHRAPYSDAPDTAAAAEAATPDPEPPPSAPAAAGAPPPSTAPDTEDTGQADVFAKEEGEYGVEERVPLQPGQPDEIPEPPPEPEQPEIVGVPAPTTEPPGDDMLPEPDNPDPPLGEVVTLTSSVPLSEVADIENPDAGVAGNLSASEVCVFAHGFALADLSEGARWTYQTDAAPGLQAEGIEAWHVETVTTTPVEHPGHINQLTYWAGQVVRWTYDVHPDGGRDVVEQLPQAVFFYAGDDGRLYLPAPPDCGG